MTNCENTTQNLNNNHVCNLSSVCSFKEIIDLSKWNEIYNCDDFEFLPYRTNAYSECNAALFRSYNDTAVEDGVTQNVYFSDTDVHVLSANIHILDGGIQSDVHGVTAGIRLQICSNNNIGAKQFTYKSKHYCACTTAIHSKCKRNHTDKNMHKRTRCRNRRYSANQIMYIALHKISLGEKS